MPTRRRSSSRPRQQPTQPKETTARRGKGRVHHDIQCNGRPGTLIVNHRNISFRPQKETDLRCRLAWEDVATIERSCRNAPKHKLKITSLDIDHGALMVQATNREKLLALHKDVRQLQEEFHARHEQQQEEQRLEKAKKKKHCLDDILMLGPRARNNDDITVWQDSSLCWNEGSAFVDDSLNESFHGSSRTKNDGGDDVQSLLNLSVHGPPVKDCSPSKSLLDLALNKNRDSQRSIQNQEEEEDFSVLEEQQMPSGPIVIEGVSWEANQGRLALQEDSIVFLEQGSTRCLYQLSWDKLHTHRISSARSSKFLLRLYADEEVYEMFQLSDRDSLLLAQQEINRLQAALLIHKFVVQSPATEGTACCKFEDSTQGTAATSAMSPETVSDESLASLDLRVPTPTSISTATTSRDIPKPSTSTSTSTRRESSKATPGRRRRSSRSRRSSIQRKKGQLRKASAKGELDGFLMPPFLDPTVSHHPHHNHWKPTETLTLSFDGQHGTNAKDGESGRTIGLHGTHGGDARPAGSGKSGDNVELIVTGNQESQTVQIQAITRAKGQVFSQEYGISECPNIHWSAKGGTGGRGGKGGNGGRGADGVDGEAATKTRYGTGGTPGGNGGNGGSGSSGKDGGRGGNVVISVPEERDAYLLMAIDACESSNRIQKLVSGGRGGAAGSHGNPGKPGKGGKGGESFEWMDSDKKASDPGRVDRRVTEGAEDGEKGSHGTAPEGTLYPGRGGQGGHFKIEVGLQRVTYPSRYNLGFKRAVFESSAGMLDPSLSIFEFGATVFCKDVEVTNTGGMPTPSQQRAMISVRGGTDKYLSELCQYACFTNRNRSLQVGRSAKAKGRVAFRVLVPDMRSMGDDLDPFVHHAKLFLDATQLGPETPECSGASAPFQRPFNHFHGGNGLPVQFAFPVENQDGIQAAKSLEAGETTPLSLSVINTGISPLGNDSRKLCIQFYRSPRPEYEDSKSCFEFLNENKEIVDAESDLTETLNGHQTFLVDLQPGQKTTVQKHLRLSEKAQAYSRVGIQAEILLEDLSAPGLMVVAQRRHFEMIVEPSYIHNKRAKAVLVTSTSTSKEQLEGWERLLDDMGLSHECYPVSRYGTLSPSFEVDDGLTLRQAFDNKLVLLLNVEFAHIDLATFLHSCSKQYSSSTQWLIVDDRGSEESPFDSLLAFSRTATASKLFNTVEEYKKFVSGQLRPGGEPESGIHVCEIGTPGQSKGQSQISAKLLSSWLKRKDPQRRYDVSFSTETSKLSVACNGYSKALNSVADAQVSPEGEARVHHGPPSCLAVAEAMSPSRLVDTFCTVVEGGANHPDFVLEALKDAAMTALLDDMSNFVSRKQGQDKKDLPSLEAWRSDPNVLALLNDGMGDAFSDLAARFASLARTRDLYTLSTPWRPKHFMLRKQLVSRVNDLITSSWGLGLPSAHLASDPTARQREAKEPGAKHHRIGSNRVKKQQLQRRKSLLPRRKSLLQLPSSKSTSNLERYGALQQHSCHL